MADGTVWYGTVSCRSVSIHANKGRAGKGGEGEGERKGGIEGGREGEREREGRAERGFPPLVSLFRMTQGPEGPCFYFVVFK